MNILSRLSATFARAELAGACFLSVVIAALILLNVVTRTAGDSLYWVDEAAVAAMVWMAFLGASASLHYRTAISVTLLPDALPAGAQRALGKLVDFVVLVFAAALLWLTFNWFDPIALARAGFSLQDFSGTTFNFIYNESTTTLGIRKFWLWLIMPLFAIGITVHALANLLASEPLEAPAAALSLD